MSETSYVLLNDNTIAALEKPRFDKSSYYGAVRILTSVHRKSNNRVHILIVVRAIKGDKYLSEVDFTVKSDHIVFNNFHSKYDDKGNGRIALRYFNNAISIIKNDISSSDITNVYGTLAHKDYGHWEKLIYMYSTFIPNSSMKIDNYPPDVFICRINSYSKASVQFCITLQ